MDSSNDQTEAETAELVARGIDNHRARGAWLRGEAPRELVLSDGTRLMLAPIEGGGIEWHRRDGLEERTRVLSAGEAQELAGDWADYVSVRTRSEAEWLRTLAEWCSTEADRLDAELADCRS